MMMVLRRTPHQIAPAVAPGMRLADKTESIQHLQGAVYSNQPDARALLAHPLVYTGWSQVLMAARDSAQDDAALRRNLEAVLPQQVFDFPYCIFHNI